MELLYDYTVYKWAVLVWLFFACIVTFLATSATAYSKLDEGLRWILVWALISIECSAGVLVFWSFYIVGKGVGVL